MYVRRWDVAALARLLKVVNSDGGGGILKKASRSCTSLTANRKVSVFQSRPERDD